jgi:hypothetical protein
MTEKANRVRNNAPAGTDPHAPAVPAGRPRAPPENRTHMKI